MREPSGGLSFGFRRFLQVFVWFSVSFRAARSQRLVFLWFSAISAGFPFGFRSVSELFDVRDARAQRRVFPWFSAISAGFRLVFG